MMGIIFFRWMLNLLHIKKNASKNASHGIAWFIFILKELFSDWYDGNMCVCVPQNVKRTVSINTLIQRRKIQLGSGIEFNLSAPLCFCTKRTHLTRVLVTQIWIYIYILAYSMLILDLFRVERIIFLTSYYFDQIDISSLYT